MSRASDPQGVELPQGCPGPSADQAQALLSPSLGVERHGEVAVLRLTRAAKRNALDDPTVLGMETFFSIPPAGIRAVVLDAEGEPFCAGLDLAELTEHDAFEQRVEAFLQSGAGKVGAR